MPAALVADFLSHHLDLKPAEAHNLARLSAGSIGIALELQDEDRERERAEAATLVRAILDGRPIAHLAVAHGYRSFGARGSFTRVLAQTRTLLRDLLAASAGVEPSDPDAIASLGDIRDLDQRTLVQALDAAGHAADLADRNVNPQLLVVNFLRQASVPLSGSPGGRAGTPRRS
jgi:hypothetical protein